MKSILSRLRASVSFKLVLVLLLCLCAGYLTRYGGEGILLAGEYRLMLSQSLWLREAAAGDRQEVMNQLPLSLNRENLTPNGKKRNETFQEDYAPGHTNFVYRIVDSQGATVQSNTTLTDLKPAVWDLNTLEWNLQTSDYVRYTGDGVSFLDEVDQPYYYQPPTAGRPAQRVYYDPDELDLSDAYEGGIITYSEDEGAASPAEESAARPEDGQGQTHLTFPEDSAVYDEAYIAPGADGAPRPVPQDLQEQSYTLEYGVLKSPVTDDFYARFLSGRTQAKKRVKALLPGVMLSALGALLALVWLLAATGHRRGVEGVSLCTLHKLPYEGLLALEGVGLLAVLVVVEVGFKLLRDFQDQWELAEGLNYLGVCAALGVPFALPLLTALTAQVKTRSLWRRSLTRKLCRSAARLGRWTLSQVRQMRLFWKAVLGCLGGLALYSLLFGMSVYLWDYGGGAAAFFVSMLILALVLLFLLALVWWLRGWRRVQEGLSRIAGGDLTYQIDTRKLPWDLAKQAACLNDLSVGMEHAVAERMKSDRFRTELITNVSHDLKTPLTSIINYVDLLKKLDIQDSTAAEYIEVLDRKSQRLKALTEDLVEASKAATGVLSVQLERLELVQLVQQSVGEYEERLDQVGLKLVTNYCPKPAWVQADGRHLWRVLDNLLNNCVKYALPGTRVYLDLVDQGKTIAISLKNISAEPLNVPPEELLERFVRGDESRTAEGSGLGLSIAQSLCQLQGMDFQVSTDGDLFKAVVVIAKAAVQ